MKKRLFLFLGLLVFVSGCASIRINAVTMGSASEFGKKAYVVRHDKSTKDIDRYIQEALTELGFAATSGPVEQMPSDVDFYVTYIDKWQWDMGMYLYRLEIMIYNKKDGVLLKSGTFRNSLFHLGHGRNWTINTVKKAFQN
jgi:hypothetical protein